MQISRIKNRLIAKLLTRFPALARSAASRVNAVTTGPTPWAPFNKSLSAARIALVTTAGVHLKTDKPFNMADSSGDPTFRAVPSGALGKELMITHDYYDHSDADRDVNIVFPIDRLRELAKEGVIGSVTKRYFSFMGHIEENHFSAFLGESLPQVAAMLKEEGADGVIVTPG